MTIFICCRVACSYRTVSYDAICVISSMIPIELIAQAQVNLYAVLHPEEKVERENTYDLIHHINIENMENWIQRISEHDCFKQYLYRFKIVGEPFCPYCSSK